MIYLLQIAQCLAKQFKICVFPLPNARSRTYGTAGVVAFGGSSGGPSDSNHKQVDEVEVLRSADMWRVDDRFVSHAHHDAVHDERDIGDGGKSS